MNLVARFLGRWFPAPLAAPALREAQEEMLWSFHRAIPIPEEGPDPVARAMEELGRQLGEDLKERLRLPASRRGGALAWRVASRLGGLRFQAREEAGRTVLDHSHCPLWDRFRRRGEIACPRFCETLARGIAEAVAPRCTLEMIRPATLEKPCVKALRGE